MSPDKSPHRSSEQYSNQKINLPLPPPESLNELKSYIGQFDPMFNLISANDSLKSEISQSDQLNPEQPLHLSNFLPQKNLEILEQSLKTLSPENPDLNFDMLLGNIALGWRIVAVFTPEGQVDHYTFNGREITKRIEQQKKLEEDALIDPLTSLYNKRFFDVETKRLSKSRHPITVFFFDINDFKNVNDTHGHPVGDIILQQFAKVLKDSFRPDDLICRIGGDEFAILIPENIDDFDTIEKLICERVNTIRKKINITNDSLPFEQHFSVSIGHATTNKNSGESLEETIKKADQCMYQDKKNKNQNNKSGNAFSPFE